MAIKGHGRAEEELVFSDAPSTEECMYTGRPLDGSNEHVLIDALGARLTSDRLVCSAFNNKMSSLDHALFQPYQFIVHQLGVKGKKGAREFVFQDASSDEKIALGPDQVPRVKEKIRPRFYEEDGKRMVQIQGSNIEQIKKVLGTIIQGGDVGAHIQKSRIGIVDKGPAAVAVEAEFDGRLYNNAIRKTALNVIGFFAPSLVRSPCLLESRRKVFMAVSGSALHEGVEEVFFRVNPEHVSESLHLGIAHEPERLMPAHRVVVSADGAQGKIVAVVDLFSVFSHAVLLTEDYSGENRTFIYWCDPSGRRRPIMEARDAAVWSLGQLQPPHSFQEVARRLDAGFRQLEPVMRAKSAMQALENLAGDLVLFSGIVFPDGARVGDVDRSKFELAARYLCQQMLNYLDVGEQVGKEIRELVIESTSEALSRGMENWADKTFNMEVRREIADAWCITVLDVITKNFEMLIRWSSRRNNKP